MASVYGLRDPRTAEIRYVGQSKQPASRYKDHLRDTKNQAKREWINELLAIGERPQLVILERTAWWDRYGCFGLERKWVDYLTAEGHRLTNVFPRPRQTSRA